MRFSETTPSMRVLGATVQPHARVFVSLTLTGRSETEPLEATFQTLVDLQKYSKIEVNSRRVAYHLPASLFAPTAWNDQCPGRSGHPLDHNAESACWVISESLLNETAKWKRGLLSERGYHTASYGLDQKKQAGSLHYAMQRVLFHGSSLSLSPLDRPS